MTRTHKNAALGRTLRHAGLGLALVLALAANQAPALANTPDWQPKVAERLVKLPTTYLRRAVDGDFAGSPLAARLAELEDRIGAKTKTLEDLQRAVEQATGDLATEMRHQFLAAKREFITLMGERVDLRRNALKTRAKLFERVLRQLDRDGLGRTPEAQAIAEQQAEARKRFESSLATVDQKLFANQALAESKYAREYAKNTAAIEQLAQAIRSHPANAQATIGGQPATKQEYLRQLLVEVESDIAIADQEENMLGYMAKLVALDAMMLAEGLGAPDGADPAGGASLASSVQFFISQ